MQHYKYTERKDAPVKHRHILIKLVRGCTPEETAAILDCSIDTVRRVMEQPCNAEFLRLSAAQVEADEEAMLLLHDDIVRNSLNLQRAAQKKALVETADGEFELAMQKKKDGTMVPMVPSSVLKSVMIDPLDHDPRGRFTKKLTVNQGKANNGFGGKLLQDFKQSAVKDGFVPAQVIDAEFEIVRDGTGVVQVSAKDVIDNQGETDPD